MASSIHVRWHKGAANAITFLLDRGYTFLPERKIQAPATGVRDVDEDSALWFLTEYYGFTTDAEATV